MYTVSRHIWQSHGSCLGAQVLESWKWIAWPLGYGRHFDSSGGEVYYSALCDVFVQGAHGRGRPNPSLRNATDSAGWMPKT